MKAKYAKRILRKYKKKMLTEQVSKSFEKFYKKCQQTVDDANNDKESPA